VEGARGEGVELDPERHEQSVLGRELHPVRVERMSSDVGDELFVRIGGDLVTAVAAEYLSYGTPHAATVGRGGKMDARAGQETGRTHTGVVVSLASRVSISANGIVVGDDQFPGRQGRLVFAYLATQEGRPIPRDELAEVLWGGVPPPTWEKALVVIVSKLRALLEKCGVDGAQALTSAFGCYRLDLPEGSSVDVVEAQRAVDDPDASAADVARAAGIAGSPFLPGDEGDWVERQRRELADVRMRALERLADASLGAGDHSEAARLAQKVVELEPYRESGYRRLMQAHAAAGNRAEGLRVYERCRRFLADELGAYPSPETDSIYKALLAAPSIDPETPRQEPPRPPLAPVPKRWSGRRAAAIAVGLLVVAAATVALVSVGSDGKPGIQPLASDRCSPLDYGGPGEPDFVIAGDLPLERGSLSFSRPMADALELALERRNYRAGRFHVGLQVCDDATPTEPVYSKAVCSANAAAFARTPSVIGVVGPFSSACAAVEIPILNEAPLAIVSPSNTLVELTHANPQDTSGAPYIYYPTGRRNYARVVASDDVQAAADAIVARKLGVRRAYVLYPAGGYAVAMASSFERTARKLRIAVIGRGSWDGEAASYTQLAARIAKTGADGIFLAGSADDNGVALVTDLRASLGPDVQIMAPDGFDPEDMVTAGGRAAEGMTMSRAGIPNERLGEAGRDFVSSFAKRFGGPPTGYAVHAAQAMDVLLAAIARSDGTRASVTRNLLTTRISNGILGSFWITSTGDTTLNAVTIYRIVHGKVTTYDTITVPEDLLDGT
jgi:branched-chain amino acid transport system substrate-binding protein